MLLKSYLKIYKPRYTVYKLPCFKTLCKSIEIGCNNPEGITRQNGENVSISLRNDL